MSIFKRRREDSPPQATERPMPEQEIPKELVWLLDAPLFIDDVQIEAFYDAMLRPELDATALQLSRGVSNQIGGGVGLAFPALVPGLSVSASGSTTRSRGDTAEYTVVSNPYRHLLSLALHYLQNVPGRMKTVTYSETGGNCEVIETVPGRMKTVSDSESGGNAEVNEAEPLTWHDPNFISKVPRALLFMDLPPQTKFIPAAVEVSGGRVYPIFESIRQQFAARSHKPPPDYPG